MPKLPLSGNLGCRGGLKQLPDPSCCTMVAVTHPSPPVHARPQVPQFIVSQRPYHVICCTKLQAPHHNIPVLLRGHHCRPTTNSSVRACQDIASKHIRQKVLVSLQIAARNDRQTDKHEHPSVALYLETSSGYLGTSPVSGTGRCRSAHAISNCLASCRLCAARTYQQRGLS